MGSRQTAIGSRTQRPKWDEGLGETLHQDSGGTPGHGRGRRALPLIALAVVVLAGLGATSCSDPASSTRAGDKVVPHPRAAPSTLPASSTVPSSATISDASTAPPPSATPGAPGTVLAGGSDQSDPFLAVIGNRYVLLTSGGTQPAPVNVPLVTSTDFVHWSAPVDALPHLPAWAAPGYTWAPDLHRFRKHTVLYFTAEKSGTSPPAECIGSAIATSPTGPFTAAATPIICQLDLGGSIDPRVFVDSDGTPWMLWKSDQNINGAPVPTQLWSQRLSADGTSLLGSPSLLMAPDESWQGTIVEAPDMVEVGGVYWVVYSGNWYNEPEYAIGAARCVGPAGPCADVSAAPLLASNSQGQGPGEASVFHSPAGVWLLYSPWRSLAPKPDIPARPVYITRLGFGPDGPYLASGPLPDATELLGRSERPPTA